MDRLTADNLALALHELSRISGALQKLTHEHDRIARLLHDHRAQFEQRARLAPEPIRAQYNPVFYSRPVTIHVPRDWINDELIVKLPPDMPYAAKAFEVLLRICQHAYACEAKLHEEGLIQQAGHLAPMLQLHRATRSEFDLPSDIKLPRAIDPFGEDEQTTIPTPEEEQS